MALTQGAPPTAGRGPPPAHGSQPARSSQTWKALQRLCSLGRGLWWLGSGSPTLTRTLPLPQPPCISRQGCGFLPLWALPPINWRVLIGGCRGGLAAPRRPAEQWAAWTQGLDAGTGRRDRTQGPDTAQFPPFIRVPAGRPPTGVKSQSPGPSAGDGLLRQQSLGGGALAGQLLETLKGDGLSTERGAPRTRHSPPLPRGPEGPVRMT